ncbi:FmdB family transcriptional regulator [Deinococcus actinosclerus]|nr:FmdB family transcriptional regulator [Deinococcus actinosclerus]
MSPAPHRFPRGAHTRLRVMPTYLYKNLETGEIYELQQSMRDEPYTTHPESGAPVKRVLARPGIAFKGSGFYVTDSRPKSGE